MVCGGAPLLLASTGVRVSLAPATTVSSAGNLDSNRVVKAAGNEALNPKTNRTDTL